MKNAEMLGLVAHLIVRENVLFWEALLPPPLLLPSPLLLEAPLQIQAGHVRAEEQ